MGRAWLAVASALQGEEPLAQQEPAGLWTNMQGATGEGQSPSGGHTLSGTLQLDGVGTPHPLGAVVGGVA